MYEDIIKISQDITLSPLVKMDKIVREIEIFRNTERYTPVNFEYIFNEFIFPVKEEIRKMTDDDVMNNISINPKLIRYVERPNPSILVYLSSITEGFTNCNKFIDGEEYCNLLKLLHTDDNYDLLYFSICGCNSINSIFNLQEFIKRHSNALNVLYESLFDDDPHDDVNINNLQKQIDSKYDKDTSIQTKVFLNRYIKKLNSNNANDQLLLKTLSIALGDPQTQYDVYSLPTRFIDIYGSDSVMVNCHMQPLLMCIDYNFYKYISNLSVYSSCIVIDKILRERKQINEDIMSGIDPILYKNCDTIIVNKILMMLYNHKYPLNQVKTLYDNVKNDISKNSFELMMILFPEIISHIDDKKFNIYID